MSTVSILQLIPPALVAIILSIACYFFYTRYVVPSRQLCSNLEKIGTTIRSMSDGDESMRKTGVGRVFQDSPFDPLWREFAKTLHMQTSYVQGQLKRTKCRITVPASHYNAEQTVPYSLPEHKTVSGWRSQSSEKGSPSVLARYLAAHVSVNSFVQTSVRALHTGAIVDFPAMSGNRPLL